MYARHYHHYDPAGTTHIMDKFRAMGWVPPSEDPEFQAKWDYYKSAEWNKESETQQ